MSRLNKEQSFEGFNISGVFIKDDETIFTEKEAQEFLDKFFDFIDNFKITFEGNIDRH